jgi:hypothetical protein
MILERVHRYRVPRIKTDRSTPPLQRAILIDPERQLVKEDVTIRTQAQDILRQIRTIVRTTERLYMASFRIGSRGRFEAGSANLAREIVQLLYPIPNRTTTHHPRNFRQSPTWSRVAAGLLRIH